MPVRHGVPYDVAFPQLFDKLAAEFDCGLHLGGGGGKGCGEFFVGSEVSKYLVTYQTV